MILILSLLVIVPIAVLSLADIPPSRTASANCASCHSSSYYQRVTLTSATAPTSIEQGSQGQVSVVVDVEGSDKRSSYTGFSITVSLSQQNSKLTLPASQSLSGQTLSGTSAPYRWSRTFSFMVTGKAGGDEVITASARMDPNHNSPAVTDSKTALTTVTVANHPPVLSLQQVIPPSGDTTTSFSYRVKYSDGDGEPPSFIKLLFDGVDQRDLQSLQGEGTDYISGVTYGISGIALGVGVHTYSFRTSDGTIQVDLPVGGNFNGPEVVRANTPPILSNGSVSPGSGSPGEQFTFTVDYLDQDNDPPSPGVRIYISGGGFISMTVDTSAPASKRDGTFSNGERYSLVRSLAEGSYQFIFNASDGAFFQELGAFIGPVVSTAPILVVSIETPLDGSDHRYNADIWFNGTYSSNKATTDVVLTWSSNISGDLGNGHSLSLKLPEGSHEITLKAFSASLDLTSSVHVGIRVLPPPPTIELTSYSPASDVIMHEMEVQQFWVEVSSNGPADISFSWTLDGSKVNEAFPDWTYIPDHSASGLHELKCRIDVDGTFFQVLVWSISVKDVPAPILYGGNLTSDLGSFGTGGTVHVSLPVSDPIGRKLKVSWSVDGSNLSYTGLVLDLILVNGPWADSGDHTLRALVENPDRVKLELLLHYSISGIIPGPGDDDGPPPPLLDGTGPKDSPDRGRLDIGLGPFKTRWPGYLIVAFGSIAVTIKMVSSIYLLTRTEKKPPPPPRMDQPLELRKDVDKEGYEIWV